MDQLAAMRGFMRVVETGSFTRAAAVLALPKATLTKQIQQLEAHLSTRLLNRTTRRVTVTPDGAAYYERALALLNDLEELDGSLSASQASPRGRLRIDLPSSLAIEVMIPALPDFLARYPDIQVDMGSTDRPVDLLGENVDCVIRAGEIRDPSLIARRIGQVPFLTCAAPSYIAAHGIPRHPSELETEHVVVRYFSEATGRYFDYEFRRDGEVIEVAGRYRVACNDGVAYLAAGLAGMGVLQAPAFLVAPHIARGALVSVLGEWDAEPLPIHVVYAPNRHLSNRVRVFVDWVADRFARANLA